MDPESDSLGGSIVIFDEYNADGIVGYTEEKTQVKYSRKNKPFDQLKYIKAGSQAVKKQQGSVKPDFAPGDNVDHPKFGRGKVLSVDGKSVKVMFDSVGVKKLAADIAPIKKV